MVRLCTHLVSEVGVVTVEWFLVAAEDTGTHACTKEEQFARISRSVQRTEACPYFSNIFNDVMESCITACDLPNTFVTWRSAVETPPEKKTTLHLRARGAGTPWLRRIHPRSWSVSQDPCSLPTISCLSQGEQNPCGENGPPSLFKLFSCATRATVIRSSGRT